MQGQFSLPGTARAQALEPQRLAMGAVDMRSAAETYARVPEKDGLAKVSEAPHSNPLTEAGIEHT